MLPVVEALKSQVDKVEGDLAASSSEVSRPSVHLEGLLLGKHELWDALAARDSSLEATEGKVVSMKDELEVARQHSDHLSAHLAAILGYEREIVGTVGVPFFDFSLEMKEGISAATEAGFKALNAFPAVQRVHINATYMNLLANALALIDLALPEVCPRFLL